MAAAAPQDAPHRAEPPRIPPPSPALIQAETEHRSQLRQAEARERRSVVRGLLLLALLLLVLSMVRAGLDRVFPHGWWRP